MRSAHIAVMTIGIAVFTWLLGWQALLIVPSAYTLGRRHATTAAPVEAGIAAMIAWSGLSLMNAAVPAFGLLVTRLGSVFPVPGLVVLLIAVLFAGLMSWSAARVVVGVRGLIAR